MRTVAILITMSRYHARTACIIESSEKHEKDEISEHTDYLLAFNL